MSAAHDPAPRFQLGRVVTLAAGHFVHDRYTALLAPWLPLLIERLGLSLLQAGSLTVLLQLPSLFNPWLGALADRRGDHEPSASAIRRSRRRWRVRLRRDLTLSTVRSS